MKWALNNNELTINGKHKFTCTLTYNQMRIFECADDYNKEFICSTLYDNRNKNAIDFIKLKQILFKED